MAASFSSPEPRRQELLHCWLPAPYRQDLAYRMVGSGQPVVFLHGLWNSSDEWKRVFDHFSPRYRLYAPDLPGNGQSPARLPWRLREVAALLAAWMRALQMPPATIVGHSMGGALAIILAAAEPQLVNRLVLVNAVGLPIQRPFLRRLTSAGQGIANHQNLRYTSRYGDPRFLQSLATWQATNEVLTCDLRPDISRIHCPTLIIWGIRDPLLPTQSAVALQRAIQGAELVMLPNVRHHPSRQVPESFDHMLEEFLGRESADAPSAEKTGD
ncbi:MAG TPA: alpha/beta hydrolase [Ktedonobacterales bacterium]|nr:alpha/beta hydrolase [Ktedonobacterales bacterium]